jgi:myo-inositol 2-dehydrogenase / D-chiro-inositol 1-dehydrogenase
VSDKHTPPTSRPNRRDFLTTAAATGAAVAAGLSWVPNVHAAGDDQIKVGLIGCGGRGTQAAENVLSSAPGVQVIAVGDYFEDRAKGCANHLKGWLAGKDAEAARQHKNSVEIPDDHCYGGLDAYEKILSTPGVNYVILATPPGFRPPHLQAAVAAGKNIFTEKPVGVDGPGIRKVLAAYDEAVKKNLCIAAGTQRRHQLGYLETMKQIHDGAIGDILTARCYWNQNDIWFHPRKSGQSDLDYQIYNWYHFLWLCGDHICEQHVHNLDVTNWALKAHPLRALGMGGRTRPCSDPNVDGQIFNFFAVEYEYPSGVHVLSQCRQIDNTDGNFPGTNGVSEALVGSKGTCQVDHFTINGKAIVTREQAKASTNPYVQEHTDLIASIRSGKPINELKNVAESTLTAILGRMSAYTGKVVTWEQALNSKLDTMPDKLSRDMKLSMTPPPVPGKTELI